LQIIARAAIAANAVGKSYSEATRTFDDYPAIIKAWLLAHGDVLSHEAWNRHIWFSRAEPYWQLCLNASSTESATEILRAAALQTLTNMSLGIAGGCFDRAQLGTIRAAIALSDVAERDQLSRWSSVLERRCA
jgi:hypothetical protein